MLVALTAVAADGVVVLSHFFDRRPAAEQRQWEVQLARRCFPGPPGDVVDVRALEADHVPVVVGCVLLWCGWCVWVPLALMVAVCLCLCLCCGGPPTYPVTASSLRTKSETWCSC